jgi:hypothetical protein
MCVVSMIGDHYKDKWIPEPPINPSPYIPSVPYIPTPILPNEQLDKIINDIEKGKKRKKKKTVAQKAIDGDKVSRKEFEELKKEVLEMKELLKKAIQYDKDKGEPDCHMDEKVELLKAVAKTVGVELDMLK